MPLRDCRLCARIFSEKWYLLSFTAIIVEHIQNSPGVFVICALTTTAAFVPSIMDTVLVNTFYYLIEHVGQMTVFVPRTKRVEPVGFTCQGYVCPNDEFVVPFRGIILDSDLSDITKNEETNSS